jgi:Ni,Fe-hydrogenase maturation factor
MSLLLSPFVGAFDMVVLGIQPATTQMGTALSDAVERAASRVADLIESGEWEKVEKL